MAEKRYSCDDCEKQFVRPEHLYRHRLNHRPKRIYTCSSCSKTFVRRDLLNRHEKRHEQGMPAHGRRTSSIISSPVDGHGSVEQSPIPPPPPAQRPSSANFGPTSIPQSLPMHTSHPSETTQLFFDSSTDQQGVREDIEWLFSNGSVVAEQGSEAYHQTPWPPPAPISLSPSSTNSFQSGDAPIPPPNEWGEVRAHVLSALDLILPAPVLQSSFFEPESLQSFYNIYFANYNAHFPILHEPTFNPQEAPPLLMVAILTLGATLSPDETHFQTAEKIHDSLRWLIFSSEAFRPPAPLWCLQALLLAQAQEKMFSSRKHHEMAHIFHGAIITLMRRGSSYTSDRAVSSDSSSLEKAWRSWIDRELGLRAAFFAFVMDAQHASIFGHTPALSVSDLRLPLPCPDRLWDASTASRWKREQARPEDVSEFLPTLRAVLARAPLPSTFCAFSRFIILHGLFSLAKHMEAREITSIDVGTNKLSLEDSRSSYSTASESGDSWRDTLDRAIETWSFSLMSQGPSLCLEAARTLHRIAHIVLHVNLIDFHVLAGAVTGAPSLTGNEITSAEYTRSKARVMEWTKKPVARRTLSHCFMMVQETIFSRHQYQAAEDNIALRPWSLYNATLIIWSWGMLTQGKSNMPVLSAEEYITHMMSSLRGTATVSSCTNLPGANRTAGLVGSVQRSLANCRWELLQEAHVTLGRLLEVEALPGVGPSNNGGHLQQHYASEVPHPQNSQNHGVPMQPSEQLQQHSSQGQRSQEHDHVVDPRPQHGGGQQIMHGQPHLQVQTQQPYSGEAQQGPPLHDQHAEAYAAQPPQQQQQYQHQHQQPPTQQMQVQYRN